MDKRQLRSGAQQQGSSKSKTVQITLVAVNGKFLKQLDLEKVDTGTANLDKHVSTVELWMWEVQCKYATTHYVN